MPKGPTLEVNILTGEVTWLSRGDMVLASLTDADFEAKAREVAMASAL